MKVQRFAVSSNKQAEREFQKHKMRTLEGTFAAAEQNIPAGSYVVDMHQPLSRLVFFLLEPESEDGVTAWNITDKYLGDGKFYPILKVIN